MENTSNNPLRKRQKEDKKLVGDFIVKQVEKTVRQHEKKDYQYKLFLEAYSFDKGFIGSYNSISEASRVFCVQSILISKALNTGESIDGLIFKYSSL